MGTLRSLSQAQARYLLSRAPLSRALLTRALLTRALYHHGSNAPPDLSDFRTYG